MLRIIAINDVYKLSNLAKVKTLVKRSNTGTLDVKPISNKRPDATVVALAGDFLSPSVLSSLDKGKSMVECLNSIPVTHVCFGNRESDVGVKHIRRRIDEFDGVWLNSNVPEFNRAVSPLPAFDVIKMPNGVSVGLMGLLLDRPNVFKDDKFYGCTIESVVDSAAHWSAKLRREQGCDVVIPLTHQVLEDDVELAKQSEEFFPAIFGGHEHHVIVKSVSSTPSLVDMRVSTPTAVSSKNGCVQFVPPPDRETTIVKTGSDAQNAAIVDIELCKDRGVVSKKVYMLSMDVVPPDEELKARVDQHLEILKHANEEIVIRSRTPLSSKRMRYEQTSVGGLFATAIRHELGVDACVLNGAPIKGNRDYGDGRITYLQLQEELPFPMKIVTVKMTGRELFEAVQYSRTSSEERGFLQLDDYMNTASDGISLDTVDGQAIDMTREYSVALPRNLLGGFCKIVPLMDLAVELKRKNMFPDKDSFTPALNLILRHFAKEIWKSLGSFDDLDSNGDGRIHITELTKAYAKKHKRSNPSDVFLSKMMDALDLDASGYIDRCEHDQLVNQS